MTDKQLADAVRAAHRALDETVRRCRKEIQDAENARDAAIAAARDGGLEIFPRFGNDHVQRVSERLDESAGSITVRRVVEV